MKRPDEVTEYLRCGGANCDGACNTQLDKLGVEDCLTWRVHGYVQKLEERIVHLEALNHQNLSVITMQERTRARLEEQISQIESNVPRWISVEEKLPEEKEDVAAIIRWNEDVTQYGIAFMLDGKWFTNGTGRVVVSHWCPLPKEVP